MAIPPDFGQNTLTMTSGTHVFTAPASVVIPAGITANRPTTATNINLQAGFLFFDTTLNKLVTYNGTVWKDGAGSTV